MSSLGYNWHAKTIKQTLTELATDANKGITSQEHQARLKKFGSNIIRKKTEFRWFILLWKQLKSPLVFILIFAGLVAAFLQEWTDATVILIAVVINSAIGVFQEGKAGKAFERLKSLVRKHSIVIRDGREKEVYSEDLVPGDIIVIRAGDSIGADARIIEEKGLTLNESVLTGEWFPREKQTDPLEEKTRITDKSNMVWMGTFAAEGWGRAVVVSTGSSTELGKIAATLKEDLGAQTPFQRGVKKLARTIGGIVVIASLIIFVSGILEGQEISEMFLTAVAISVAAIPEGLPIATTVILAIGMSRILAKKGLVRNLMGAETLGSTTIILTDKTGTLTKAEMQVSDIIIPEEVLYAPKTEDEYAPAKLKALEIAVFSSDAFVENPESELKDWKVRGNPTDKAMLMAGIQAGIRPHELLKNHPRIDFMPFDPEKRFSASLNKTGKKIVLSLSGAPEKILSMSVKIKEGTKTVKLTEAKQTKLINEYQKATGKGSRVLAVAYKEGTWEEIPRNTLNNKNKNASALKDFIFAGFISFHDPLREDVRSAIATARLAGLRPIMMTGDHKSTAKAIALQAGLSEKDNLKIMDGEELEHISEKKLDEIIEKIDIYARVLPHQKKKIVEAWQRKGEVVAMTGDGVNDAPALKRADVGIALGSGTEVAKEASDIVLLNNSFSIIVSAIEEGRVIMDNLRKVVTFLLATGFTEIVLIGGALLSGLPLPVLPAQILWANLVEEGFMNFAFAFEPKENDVMKRNPHLHSSSQILTQEITWIIFGIGILTDIFLFLLFLVLMRLNYPIGEIRTIMFAGLAIDAIFFVYAVKSLRRPLLRTNIFSNPYLIWSSIISMALLVAALTLPPLKSLLSLTEISLYEFLIICALGFIDLVSIELVKYYFIHKADRHPEVV